MYYLGVDLGGTKTAAAVVDQTGKLLAKAEAETPQSGGPEAVADRICSLVGTAAAQAGLAAGRGEPVGIGAPGIVDPDRGVIEYWSCREYHDVPLGRLVEDRLGRPVRLENDANAAALGEFAAGAGRGADHMVLLTLGTGVGGGIILNRKLYTGKNRAAGEMGHFVIVKDGLSCSCGRRGCFEAYASATALVRQTREAMERDRNSALWAVAGGALSGVTGRTAFRAKGMGDPAAAVVVEEFCSYLACGVVNLVNLLQPDVLCIGGGLSGEGEALLGPVRAILDREDYARYGARRAKLEAARLGNDAGLIGAALLPLYR